MTITGGVNTDVCLQTLYDSLCNEMPMNVTYIEFGKNKHELQSVGINTKYQKKKKKTEKPKNRFDNQLTIVITTSSRHNVKLFKNGNVQMTGVKSELEGKTTIDYLIDIIRARSKTNPSIVSNIENLQNINYRIRLINSDFKINYEIRLDHLYKLITSEYNIVCSYEPCIYPGAKIEYYFPTNGFCKCTTFCNGKSDICKKITIAVFQSGCIIITGANKIEHVEVAYKFICDILKNDCKKVYRNKLKLPKKETVSLI
jgi:TATA-box binding protein (TBP) (component of TFIID and TFIIIB)